MRNRWNCTHSTFPPSFLIIKQFWMEEDYKGKDESKVKVKSLSRVLTLCDPMDCTLPGSSVHGIFQAIVLKWIAISFSRGSSWPRDQTQVSHIVDRRFTVWAIREVQKMKVRKGIILWVWSSEVMIFLILPLPLFLRKYFILGWRTHVHPWLIHFNVWQKPPQYCKVISL